MPLLLALHGKNVLALEEIPHYYEDVLVRRKLDLKQDPADLAFLEALVPALHRLVESPTHRAIRNTPPT